VIRIFGHRRQRRGRVTTGRQVELVRFPDKLGDSPEGLSPGAADASVHLKAFQKILHAAHFLSQRTPLHLLLIHVRATSVLLRHRHLVEEARLQQRFGELTGIGGDVDDRDWGGRR
jgi:hypothetical protein